MAQRLGEPHLEQGLLALAMKAVAGGQASAALDLLQRARAENQRVVLSIFVNPTQFNDPNDLANYPRTLEADLERARPYADAVLAPSSQEFYRDGFRYRMTEVELSRRWREPARVALP